MPPWITDQVAQNFEVELRGTTKRCFSSIRSHKSLACLNLKGSGGSLAFHEVLSCYLHSCVPSDLLARQCLPSVTFQRAEAPVRLKIGIVDSPACSFNWWLLRLHLEYVHLSQRAITLQNYYCTSEPSVSCAGIGSSLSAQDNHS